MIHLLSVILSFSFPPCTVFSHSSPESSANIVRRNFSGETSSLMLGKAKQHRLKLNHLQNYPFYLQKVAQPLAFTDSKSWINCLHLRNTDHALERDLSRRIHVFGMSFVHFSAGGFSISLLIYGDESINTGRIPTYYFIICGDSLFTGCDIII